MKARLGSADHSEEFRRLMYRTYHEKKDELSVTQIALSLGIPPQSLYNAKNRMWWLALDKEAQNEESESVE